MEAFSPAVFSGVVDEITEGISDLEKLAKEFGPNARALLEKMRYDPIVILTKDAILWCVDEIVDLLESFLKKAREAVEGIFSPVGFYKASMDWPNLVIVPASRVAGATVPGALAATDGLLWTGDAADRYSNAVADQTVAAAGIQALGEKMRVNALDVAKAGLAFYAGLIAIIVSLTVDLGAATAAIATAVGAPEGAAAAAAATAAQTAFVVGLVALLGSLVEGNIVAMSDATAAATLEAFPNTHWPSGVLG